MLRCFGVALALGLCFPNSAVAENFSYDDKSQIEVLDISYSAITVNARDFNEPVTVSVTASNTFNYFYLAVAQFHSEKAGHIGFGAARPFSVSNVNGRNQQKFTVNIEIPKGTPEGILQLILRFDSPKPDGSYWHSDLYGPPVIGGGSRTLPSQLQTTIVNSYSAISVSETKANADKIAANKTAAEQAGAADAAIAATDAALAASDAALAATAAAEDASATATSLGTEITKIATQIEKLDVALENAKAAYAIATNAFENARKQESISLKYVNAQSNSIGKLALSTAVVRLSNAVKILDGSRSKLATQVVALDAKKSFLLSEQEKMMTNAPGESTSTSSVKSIKKDKTIVCLKGKSSLKVIGKNPKCPAGYKVKK